MNVKLAHSLISHSKEHVKIAQMSYVKTVVMIPQDARYAQRDIFQIIKDNANLAIKIH